MGLFFCLYSLPPFDPICIASVEPILKECVFSACPQEEQANKEWLWMILYLIKKVSYLLAALQKICYSCFLSGTRLFDEVKK